MIYQKKNIQTNPINWSERLGGLKVLGSAEA